MTKLDHIYAHEVSHGIVALEQGFDAFERVFIDMVTPAIMRRGGIDIQIDGLRERFDSARPVGERRELAVKVVAIFAAGREGELLFYNEADKKWCSWDEEQIEWFSLAGVYEDEDLDLLNKSPKRENGWGKWSRVDSVIAEGRDTAAKILRKHAAAIKPASTFLLQSVQSMRGKGYITRDQLSRIMGKQPPTPLTPSDREK